MRGYMVPREAVKTHIINALDVALDRVHERVEEQFTSEFISIGNGSSSPFQKLLLPEARRFNYFERSLSTALGKALNY